MTLKTNPKNAAVDMVKALRPVFKRYSYQSRQRAWEGLISGKGKTEMEKMLMHPDRDDNNFSKLSFKEWMIESK